MPAVVQTRDRVYSPSAAFCIATTRMCNGRHRRFAICFPATCTLRISELDRSILEHDVRLSYPLVGCPRIHYRFTIFDYFLRVLFFRKMSTRYCLITDFFTTVLRLSAGLCINLKSALHGSRAYLHFLFRRCTLFLCMS